MANLLFPAFLVAVLGGGVATGVVGIPVTDAHVETSQPAVVQSPQNPVWTLTNTRSGDLCRIEKMDKMIGPTSKINLDAACNRVFAESAFVSVWREDDEGNVSLDDDQGNALAEFSYSTEAGWVSITAEPGGLTLSPSS